MARQATLLKKASRSKSRLISNSFKRFGKRENIWQYSRPLIELSQIQFTFDDVASLIFFCFQKALQCS